MLFAVTVTSAKKGQLFDGSSACRCSFRGRSLRSFGGVNIIPCPFAQKPFQPTLIALMSVILLFDPGTTLVVASKVIQLNRHGGDILDFGIVRNPRASLRPDGSVAPSVVVGHATGSRFRSFGRRARKIPHPKTQSAQNDEGQHTWPQRHRMTGDQHLWAYHQPYQLRDGHQTEHDACNSQSCDL